nr:phage tail protein [Citrobacter sp. JL978]
MLTNIGAAKLANATALGAQVEITQMAVGDGNGVLPTPNPTQTALTHELRRAQLNMLTIDPVNTNQIIAEQVIPEDVGGWWIREIGLFDKDGDMIAVANCAETYKPLLQEGSGRVQVVRIILIVSSTEAVTLKIDPSVVLATRKYVDDAVIEVKAYVDQALADHVDADNPHSQYLRVAQNLKEIANAGTASVNAALKNLGIDGLAATPRYLVTKGSNSNGWYEIYSDGLIRQGMKYPNDSPLTIATPAAGATVTYPVSFKTTIINIILALNAGVDNGLEWPGYTSESLSSIRVLSMAVTNSANATGSYLSKFVGYIVVEGY